MNEELKKCEICYNGDEQNDKVCSSCLEELASFIEEEKIQPNEFRNTAIRFAIYILGVFVLLFALSVHNFIIAFVALLVCLVATNICSVYKRNRRSS